MINLPSRLIQAGFAGVVGTQWAIRSEAISLLVRSLRLRDPADRPYQRPTD